MANMPEDKARFRAFYAGTHDNDTLAGFTAREHPDFDAYTVSARALDDIKQLYHSPAPLVMMQLQDVFMLGSDARMNVPGIAEGNWRWRVPAEDIGDAYPDAGDRAAWFRELAARTGRY